jgi:DMSO reductase anchor subunit
MHAALSVLIFTVTAGFGLGFLGWSGMAHLFNDQYPMFAAIFIGGILTTIGLLASTFHLANPKNAWRAFNRFRTSWLSREGVFSVLLYPLLALGVLAISLDWLLAGQKVLSVLIALLSISIIYCTSMIYACLKTIRQWHNALVPINFMLMGLSSGALLGACYLGFSAPEQQSSWQILAAVFLVLALIGKALYYFWIGKPAGPTINTAIGMTTQASVKLLDVGHEGGTFLQREFGHKVATSEIMKYRMAVYILAFIIPIILLILIANPYLLLIAVIANYLGLLVERWLFFVEARHVVNLFHGDQST